MPQLILVDKNDNQIGVMEKRQAHLSQGKLHRAISVFLFNTKGELLLQQRSQNKMLWPGYWANTCCSHPQPGESYKKAAERRLNQEFGLKAKLKPHHQFTYKASYKKIGSEHEIDTVFIGVSDDQPQPNKKEISAWKYLKLNQVKKDIQINPNQYGPWVKLALQTINSSDILPS